MKKLISLCFALYMLLPGAEAQKEWVRPKALGVSFFLNDFITPARIRSTSLSQVLSDKKFAKMREMSPGLALNYFKGISNHVDFAATIGGSFIRYPMPGKVFSNDRFLLEASATVNLKMTTEKYWVQPYIILGVGGHKYTKYYGAFMPLGLGMKVNFWDDVHMFITSTYRVPVTTETANYHLQHSIGFAGALKKKEAKVIPPPPPPPPPPSDRDKDGIIDDEDKCPDVFGLARYQGCPIPDRDKDGINDEEDKCPTVPGVARYQGCPIPDTDGDGVNDEEDKCITIPGPASNFGCPVIPEEIIKRVQFAAKNILFVSGSAKLQSKSFKGLADVAKIMNENPNMKLAIDGHTDNVGKDDMNQKLSDNRAASVMSYIVSKGVDASRITSQGHGETTPIATNNTAAGRQQNRRVELTLSYYTKEVKQ